MLVIRRVWNEANASEHRVFRAVARLALSVRHKLTLVWGEYDKHNRGVLIRD